MITKIFNNNDYKMMHDVYSNSVTIQGKKTVKFNINKYNEFNEMVKFMKNDIKLSVEQIIGILDKINDNL